MTNNNPLKVFPNQGIGPVKFGMSPVEVRGAMGTPEVYEDWMGGNLNDSLLYPGLIIGFDQCDANGPLINAKVVEFQTNSTDRVSFNGITLNQLTRGQMIDMEAFGEMAKLDHNRDICFKTLGLTFSFRENGTFYALEMWNPDTLKDESE